MQVRPRVAHVSIVPSKSRHRARLDAWSVLKTTDSLPLQERQQREALLQLVQQLAGAHVKATGKSQDRRQPGLTCPTLETANRGRVDIRVARKVVLGEVVLDPELAQPPAERGTRGGWILVYTLHPWMLVCSDQWVQSGLVGSALVYIARMLKSPRPRAGQGAPGHVLCDV